MRRDAPGESTSEDCFVVFGKLGYGLSGLVRLRVFFGSRQENSRWRGELPLMASFANTMQTASAKGTVSTPPFHLISTSLFRTFSNNFLKVAIATWPSFWIARGAGLEPMRFGRPALPHHFLVWIVGIVVS